MTVIKRQTIFGTIYSYFGAAIGIIIQAFLLPKYLKVDEVGLIAILFNWALIFVFVANMGFNSAGTKYFSDFRNNNAKHNGYLFNGLFFLLIGTTIVGVILILFKSEITNSKIADSLLFKKYYPYILPITFFLALFNIFDNYAKGLYDTLTGTFLSQFLQRFLILCVVILFIFNFFDFSWFVFYWVVALSLPTLFMISHAISIGDFSIKPNSFLIKATFFKDYLRFSAFSIVTGLSSIVISKIDSIMVYQYLGLSNIGIYNFCLLFGSLMTMSYMVNMKASTAIVLDAMNIGDYAKVGQIFKKSSETQVVFGCLILLLVWINIDDLFKFIKPEYSIGKYVILIIGISKIYDLSSGINSLILTYSKYYKIDSILIVSFVGILYLLNFVFIPKFGLNGAAIAALLATVYYNSVRNFLIWKFFKIHPYSYSLIKIIMCSVIVASIAYFIPGQILKSENQIIILVFIGLKSIFASILFLLGIYFLKLSNEINQLISVGINFLSKQK